MWRSWGWKKYLWLISLVKPFLLSFSPPVLLEKAVVKGSKQVRSEEFNIVSFTDGNLWWGWLYPRLAQGASWWGTHAVLGCLLWSHWVKARALTFPHRSFSAEAWSISASLSKEKKRGSLDQSQLDWQKCWGPACPRMRAASAEGEVHCCRRYCHGIILRHQLW